MVLGVPILKHFRVRLPDSFFNSNLTGTRICIMQQSKKFAIQQREHLTLFAMQLYGENIFKNNDNNNNLRKKEKKNNIFS